MKKVYCALALIFLIGFFLRFDNLGSYSALSRGEAEYYQAAKEYQRGNLFNNFYTYDTPPLEIYMFSAALGIFNSPEFAMRIVPLIFGMITLPLLFIFTRKITGNTNLAVFSTALLAFAILHIQFSRYAKMETAIAFFYLLSMFFFWKILRNEKGRSWLYFGVSLGLGLVINYIMIYVYVAVILYAFVKKMIEVRLRPRFSLSVDNRLLKAVIISIIVFFLVWPFSLYSHRTNILITVEDLGGHPNEFDASIPTFILSFSKRLSHGFFEGSEQTSLAGVPVLGYLYMFVLKENLLLVALFAAGFCATLKRLNEPNMFILFNIALFLILISLQNWGNTYRYLAIIMPFMAIIAANSLTLVKKNKNIFMVALTVLILLTPAMVHPRYELFYNPVANISVSQLFSESSVAMKEMIGFLSENCTSAYMAGPYLFIFREYVQDFATDNITDVKNSTCVVIGKIEENIGELEGYVKEKNCRLFGEINKEGYHIFDIYKC